MSRKGNGENHKYHDTGSYGTVKVAEKHSTNAYGSKTMEWKIRTSLLDSAKQAPNYWTTTKNHIKKRLNFGNNIGSALVTENIAS
jgi:hypothetical protein